MNSGDPDALKTNSGNPIKILVVEDNPNVATVLEARLQSFGFEVCAIAGTGLAAVHGAVAHHPDVVLMDILLDGEMNGIEAAELIHNQMAVPIIFVTCLSDPAMLDKAITTNAFGYVLKPYDNAELRYAIEIAVVKHRAGMHQERLIGALEKALLNVKKLSGLLCICASCKKIRDDQGQWQPLEGYIQSRSEADFTHGICPQCSHVLYPQLYAGKDQP